MHRTIILLALLGIAFGRGIQSEIQENVANNFSYFEEISRDVDYVIDYDEFYKDPNRHGCGVMENRTKIVGGENVEPHSYNYMAALILKQGAQFCGGSIINSNYILTAAHCVSWLAAGYANVLLGAHNISRPYTSESGQIIALSVIRTHPYYNPGTVDYDMAVIRLATPVKFTQHISPICLPTASEDVTGHMAEVTGWGAIHEGGPTSKILKKVQVPIIHKKVCAKAYDDKITNRMICAGYDDGKKDSCQGDSGGPLILIKNGKRVQEGVVSWGKGCARPDYPGVYSRISEMLGWLAVATIRSSCSK